MAAWRGEGKPKRCESDDLQGPGDGESTSIDVHDRRDPRRHESVHDFQREHGDFAADFIIQRRARSCSPHLIRVDSQAAGIIVTSNWIEPALHLLNLTW